MGFRKEKILITGAAGCVGHQLISLLARRGFRLRLTDRPGSALPRPTSHCEVIPADLTDFTQMPSLTKGVAAIIHLAAIVDVGLDLDQLTPLNLEAVRHLYEAAQEAGVRRFIFFSTGSIYAFKDDPCSERDPVQPLNDYGWSKLLAEDYLLAQRHLPVTIIRPALIFGPRGRVLLNLLAPLPSLAKMIRSNLPKIDGGPQTNSVHSYDVANAALFLLEHPQPHGEIFNVANDDPLTVGKTLEILMRTGGIRISAGRLSYPTGFLEWGLPLLSQPSLLKVLNQSIETLWQYVRWKNHLQPALAPKVDSEILDFLAQGICFSNRKIKRLGFRLKYPDFTSGWQDTIRWMRRERWLP